MEMKNKTNIFVRGRRKKTKVKAACCASYVTVLVACALGLETTILHVPDPTVGCICIPIMVAIPLFPIYIYSLAILQLVVD
jgi:hypothetical protein